MTAREVVQAHIDRLHARQPRTNALACARFAEALGEADAADERVEPAARTAAVPRRAVHDQGVDRASPACRTAPAWWRCRDRRAETTAPAAQRLRDAGFIPLGVTNTSELTMWIESVNRVYGRTRNAYDPQAHRRRLLGRRGRGGRRRAARRSGSALTSAARSACPRSSTASSATSRRPGSCPTPASTPAPRARRAFMLTLGPLARHAEDLMPVTRIIAGPDGVDERCVARELGDPRSSI